VHAASVGRRNSKRSSNASCKIAQCDNRAVPPLMDLNLTAMGMVTDAVLVTHRIQEEYADHDRRKQMVVDGVQRAYLYPLRFRWRSISEADQPRCSPTQDLMITVG
jgi:hypothetical protein